MTQNKNHQNNSINIKIYSIKEFGSQRKASHFLKTQPFFFPLSTEKIVKKKKSYNIINTYQYIYHTSMYTSANQ